MIDLSPSRLSAIGIKSFEQNEIRGANQELLGLQALAIGQDGVALGGGVAQDLNTARRIAVAEVLERHFVTTANRAEWMLDSFPTSCGFAAGFDLEPTRLRSKCEGVERWVWSKWIDLKTPIRRIPTPPLTALAACFAATFTQVLFFELELPVDGQLLKTCIAIGLDETGAFPGSRCCPVTEDGWTHALVEVWRHKLVSTGSIPNQNVLFYKRIFHFAKHREQALAQIPAALDTKWPTPALLFQKTLRLDDHYICRTLFGPYLPWNAGDETRFVY